MNALVMILGAIGLARIVTHSWVFKGLRTRAYHYREANPGYLGEAFDEFTHCSQCVGFWCGLACSPLCADGWLSALAIAGTASLLATVLDRAIAKHL